MYLPNKKLTVNHEKIPSSTPSIIDTESSVVKNGVFLKSSLTELSKFSAFSTGSNLKPAVAFRVSGVLLQYSSGISSLAFSRRELIDATP